MKKIGALWIKESEKGKFMTGNIEYSVFETIPVVIFKNDRKEKDNQPDYNIFLSEKKKANIAEELYE